MKYFKYVILILFLTIFGITLFIYTNGKNNTAEINILDTTYIKFNDNIKGWIYLKTKNLEINENTKTGAYTTYNGALEFKGDSYIEFLDQKISLGERVFAEGGYIKPNIEILYIQDTKTRIIAIPQYGTSAVTMYDLFTWNEKTQKLERVKFNTNDKIEKALKLNDKSFIEDNSGIFKTSSHSNACTVKELNNNTCFPPSIYIESWNYNPEKITFEFISQEIIPK